MKITSINLRHFRNLEQLQAKFHPHLNIFVGNNGQGKTNILESLVYLSAGRSFRVSHDKFLIKHDEDHAKIEALINQEKTISVVLSDQGKYMMVNQENITKLSDFIGQCNVVLFNPDDLQFFTQTPRKRRKDIDYELGKSSKIYLQNLLKVNQLIQNRNAFLKQNKQDEVYLEILDQQIASLSEVIILKRKDYTKFISDKAQMYYQEFTNTNVNIHLEYEACIDLKEDNYNFALVKKMKDNRRKDMELRVTNIGIHREDFIFKMDNYHVVDVMSQGQRRLLMIAYKLAVIDWFMLQENNTPIFCMDDLFSELDENMRQIILEKVNPNLQIFITTTDLSFIKTQKEKTIFEIEKGTIRRKYNG